MSEYYLVYTPGHEASAEVNFRIPEEQNVLLHIAFRPAEGKLVLNQFRNGLWGTETNVNPPVLAGVYHFAVAGGGVRIWRDGTLILERTDLDPRLGNADVSTTEDTDLISLQPDTVDHALKKILVETGFADALWLSSLDAQDYANLNSDLDLDGKDRASALRHFLDYGISELRPYSSTELFDPEFYQTQCSDQSFATAADAYQHWVRKGRRANLACSEAFFLSRLGNPPFPTTFNWPAYAAIIGNDDPIIRTRHGAFAHLLASVDDGDPGLAALGAVKDQREAASLLAFFGQRHLKRQDDDAALTAYGAALDLDPGLVTAHEGLGTCLFNLGDSPGAAQSFRSALERSEPSLPVLTTLVATYLRMGNHACALKYANHLATAYPEEDQARAAVRDARWASFKHHRQAAHILCQSGDRAGATEAMLAYRDPLPALGGGPIGAVEALRRVPEGQKPRIIILGDPFLKQCVAYRINQKLEHLERAGYDALFVPSTDVREFLDQSPFYDIAIFYRVPARPDIVEAITRARQQGMVTIFEIDDLIFDPQHFPDDLVNYGTDLTPYEHANLVVDTPLVLKAMELCDYGLTTTKALQEIMAPKLRRKQCFLHRNAFDARHARFAQLFNPQNRHRKASDTVTLLYGSGTKAHAEDFEVLVAPALARILEKHPHTRFMGIGYLPAPEILKPWADRIDRLEPVWDLDAYWSLVADTDINLAMLKDNLISDCKSEIKWLEAAMLGVPSIVSPTRNYHETQVDGKTALFAANPGEWFETLDALVSSVDLRQRIGKAAYDHATKGYGVEIMARNIDDVLSTVMADATSHARPRRPQKKPAKSAKPVVTICNVFFSPQLIGGATRVVKDNVDYLLDHHGDDFEIQVFCAMEGGDEPYQVRSYGYRGARVTAVTHPQAEHMDLVPFDPRMGEIFETYLNHFAPDLIHFHCIQRLTASIVERARARTIPYLITAHDAWWISDHQFLVDEAGQLVDEQDTGPRSALRAGNSRAASALARTMRLRGELTGADRILSVSDSFARTYQRFGVAGVTVVENGVSASLVPREKMPSKGPVRLGLIGGMQAHKGLPLLKAALLTNRFENLHVTIVDLNLPPDSLGRREIWGTIPVQFIGKVPQERVADLYAKLDVLLAPSIWPESYGLVTREALLCGLWVIASDRGAIGADVTPGQNGFVIDVSNTKGLIGALTEIDGDPDHYRASPEQRPNLRSSDDQGADLARLYRELLKRRQPRLPLGLPLADRLLPGGPFKKSA